VELPLELPHKLPGNNTLARLVNCSKRYCQDLWMSEFQAASSVVGGSIGRSTNFPGSSSPKLLVDVEQAAVQQQ
jgi:hypothetical protein